MIMNTIPSVTSLPAVHKLSFSDLRIGSSMVEDYIGFLAGSTPEPFPELIREILSEAEGRIKPLGGYVIYNEVYIDSAHIRISIGDLTFGTGPIVTRHLGKSEFIALFACTAGKEVSEWAALTNKKENSIHAYVIDSLGSIVGQGNGLYSGEEGSYGQAWNGHNQPLQSGLLRMGHL
jgi:hypothetical protein